MNKRKKIKLLSCCKHDDFYISYIKIHKKIYKISYNVSEVFSTNIGFKCNIFTENQYHMASIIELFDGYYIKNNCCYALSAIGIISGVLKTDKFKNKIKKDKIKFINWYLKNILNTNMLNEFNEEVIFKNGNVRNDSDILWIDCNFQLKKDNKRSFKASLGIS